MDIPSIKGVVRRDGMGQESQVIYQWVGVGSIPVAILPSCLDMKTIAL